MAERVNYLIDIGVNLCNDEFSEPEKILDVAYNNNLEAIINIGTNFRTSQQGIKLCEQFKEHPLKLYTTAGIHPHSGKSHRQFDYFSFINQFDNPFVVAVGECGLDYNRMFSPVEDQLLCFRKQIMLANKFGKPLYLHERDSFDDFTKCMKEYQGRSAVIHCFTGTKKEAEYYVACGFHIGLTGFVCRNKNLSTFLAQVVPVDKIMLESDAPYQKPHPEYYQQPSYPEDVNEVAEEVARIYGMSVEDLVTTCTQTTKDFFNLGDDTNDNADKEDIIFEEDIPLDQNNNSDDGDDDDDYFKLNEDAFEKDKKSGIFNKTRPWLIYSRGKLVHQCRDKIEMDKLVGPMFFNNEEPWVTCTEDVIMYNL